MSSIEVLGAWMTELKRPGFKGVKIMYEISGPSLVPEKGHTVSRGPRMMVVDYQPGNGTMYEVQLSYLPNRPDSRFLMNVVNFRKSMPINHHLHEHSLGYMKEKLGLNEADCYALIPLVNEFINQCMEA